MAKKITFKIDNCWQCRYAQYSPHNQDQVFCAITKEKFSMKENYPFPDTCKLEDYEELP